MCGIGGVVRFDGAAADARALTAMGAAMRHRGPDDAGVFVDREFGLVHRRLSIIDLDSGKQPIFNEDRSIVTVLNGELYNFQELRRDLEQRGHRFSTRSDTEVLVHLYEEAGDLSFLERVNGMFAFALLDRRRRLLWLARDRVGKKPLYVYQDTRQLAFASELTALQTLPGLELEVDPAAVDCYFHYQYIPSPLSIFKKVRKLPAAHWLRIRGADVGQQAYWRIPLPEPDLGRSEAEYREEFEALLDDAVRLRMISDVPLGAFLSGGIDSSMVVALMSQHQQASVRTFSIGFHDASYDESEISRSVAGQLGVDHRVQVLETLDPTAAPDILANFGEPFADSSAIPTHHLCRMARQGVTVALSGDGADEILGGYNRYVAGQFAERYFKLPAALRPRWLLDAIRMLPEGRGYYGKSRIKKLKLLARFLHNQESDPQNVAPFLFSNRERGSLFSADYAAAIGESGGGDPVLAASRRYAGLDRTSQMLWTDFATYLPDDIHTKVDRMSMAHSLEVRAPFMDYRLVEFVARMPLRHKIRGTHTKRLLKAALGKRLPAIASRPKQGFEVPIAHWIADELREPLGDALASPLAGEYFDTQQLQRLVKEHQQGFRDHAKRIWAAYVFLLWAERNVSAG